MTDRIEKIGGSIIQHGPSGSRVYLMRLDRADWPDLDDRIDRLARDRNYGKIFARIPAGMAAAFLERGYREEARIPAYYPLAEDAVFMARYYDPARERDRDAGRTAEVLRAARAHARAAPPELPQGYRCRKSSPRDIDALAGLYRMVFASYPFPIHDRAWLAETMRSHTVYYGIWDGDCLAAAASAERDPAARAAEMTDFATRPEYRRRGLARRLLADMEADREALDIRMAYTIARAGSQGMNIAFASAGYRFGGTLVNNTQIGGRIESMNVWHRRM